MGMTLSWGTTPPDVTDKGVKLGRLSILVSSFPLTSIFSLLFIYYPCCRSMVPPYSFMHDFFRCWFIFSVPAAGIYMGMFTS
ncbi:hypothetical protein BT67DRAFT_445375 [Trichocladium antarcticum]|uniref:Uncharacterized protein n=1 Tax=Trichocladium antarcticum TaxID=1450529 RepID=A0AAN6UDM3_9PEZI|nr:hypothetical protein BT67DRAFT_445375 [Trichocladium antarcticum]